jgi:DNA-binding HxlR family transcriptional regulator
MELSASRSSSRPRLRAGGAALTLLSSSLNLEVLHCLAAGPQRLQALMRNLGFPPRSTTRLYLQTLAGMGVVEHRRRSEFPASVEYEITEGGRALLEVSGTVQTWLQSSPAGPIALGSTAARSAVKALVEGWGSNIVRVLATRSLSLTELNLLLPQISYPTLERRLTAMRQVGLLEVHHTGGRVAPYTVTRWLRLSVAPVVAAIRWEGAFAADQTPDLGRHDVEGALLLADPLRNSAGERLPRRLEDGADLLRALARAEAIVASVERT